VVQIKNTIEKFENGDSLSDTELKDLIVFYSDLEEKLKLLGPKYHLFFLDVFYKVDTFKSFERSRCEK